ncbi:MAG: agmatine deiminase family protein [Pseudanabaena sp. ELA607]
MSQSPQDLGYRQPAEWQTHRTCWLAFPSHGDLWLEYLEIVQAEFVALAKAIAQSEPIQVLVLPETAAIAAQMLQGVDVTFHQIPFGDIWMRDITPIFTRHAASQTVAGLQFNWNGWGGKYLLEHDEQVAERVINAAQVERFCFDYVLEGGAVEVDGLGTCLTTKQCLLNPNRNPQRSPAQIEADLQQALGVEKVLWLESGLLNDHTDGHIDTIARFIAPHTVMCMTAKDANDPNAAVLADIADQLASFTDAEGKPLQVVQIPSPGLVLDPEGEIMPASYLNFYIANGAVIVPTYGTPYDALAVEMIGQYFPNRKTIGLSAKHILLGGGAFHCITCHQPL